MGCPRLCNIVSIGQLARLSHLLTYELNLAVVFDMIEGDADSGNLSMENSKLAAVGFPCKCYDAFWKDRTHNRSGFFFLWETITINLCVYVLTLHLHHINRNLLLSHAEDFKVGDHTLKKIEK